jgi:hypothetical protein
MKVMPFKCAKCGVDFSYDEGGTCSKCNKPFCNNHLFEVKVGKEAVLYCETDKGDMKGNRRKSDLLKIREKLSKFSSGGK